MKRALTTIAVAAVLAFAPLANAGIISYAGIDPGVAAGGAKPNSDLAAAQFAAAAGLTPSINFENVPVGTLGSGVAGVTISASGDFESVEVTADDSTILGYNTTSGGENHLRTIPSGSWDTGDSLTVSFIFDSPIQAFGAYFTGIESDIAGSVRIVFSDGSVNSLALLESVGGGVQFFGFTDFDKSIAQVDLIETNLGANGTRDIWGVDDVHYLAATTVPEPSTMLLMGAGLLAARARRRRPTAKP